MKKFRPPTPAQAKATVYVYQLEYMYRKKNQAEVTTNLVQYCKEHDLTRSGNDLISAKGRRVAKVVATHHATKRQLSQLGLA